MKIESKLLLLSNIHFTLIINDNQTYCLLLSLFINNFNFYSSKFLIPNKKATRKSYRVASHFYYFVTLLATASTITARAPSPVTFVAVPKLSCAI